MQYLLFQKEGVGHHFKALGLGLDNEVCVLDQKVHKLQVVFKHPNVAQVEDRNEVLLPGYLVRLEFLRKFLFGGVFLQVGLVDRLQLSQSLEFFRKIMLKEHTLVVLKQSSAIKQQFIVHFEVSDAEVFFFRQVVELAVLFSLRSVFSYILAK